MRYSSKKGTTDSCDPDETLPDRKECHSNNCNNKVMEINSYFKDLFQSNDYQPQEAIKQQSITTETKRLQQTS